MNGEPFNTQFGHGIIDAEAGLRVASGLNTASNTPDLLQAGSTKSEHTFGSNMTLSSGCRVASGTYCTVFATDPNGFERFLPYATTNGTNQASWNWPSSWLGAGDWSLYARSGDNKSTSPYMLLNR